MFYCVHVIMSHIAISVLYCVYVILSDIAVYVVLCLCDNV